MQPLIVVFGKIKTGFSGVPDTSCYTHVGLTLRERGTELTTVVVALYTVPGTHTYVHAAIETEDGILIDERQAPPHFRDADGRPARSDMARAIVPVPAVLGWLQSSLND